MQGEKNTEYLESELKRTNKLNDFFAGNEKELRVKSVPEYLNDMLIQYNADKSDVVRNSGLSGTYAYQIFDGRKSAGREKLLQLAFGFPLSLDETQHLLRFGGHNELYVKKKRDAYMMYALTKGYTLEQVNELLYQNGEKTFE